MADSTARLRTPAAARGAHHRDVGVADRQDAGRPERCRRDRRRTRSTGPAPWHQRVVRQVRRQVGAHRHRTDARAAAAVRDRERLVQVEVADVGAEPARLGEAEQRVEVGAVDVDLAARPSCTSAHSSVTRPS